MAFRPPIFAVLCLLAVIPLPGTPATKEKLDDLLNNSPFGSARTNAGTGTGTGDPLEFRAVLEESGKLFFSIYEASTRRSTWVEMNDPANGFAVKSYDAAHDTVAVDFRGKTMSLPIKRATPVAAVPVGVGPSNQVNSGGPTPIDQQRLQQIQEEIRRRRALRQQPPVPATLIPGAQSGPQPMPVNPANEQFGPRPILNNPAGSASGPQPSPDPAKQ